jgi:hypothetical protein
MDVLQSKLAKRHGELAKEIKALLTEAQILGARGGVLRIELVCDQYDQVLPDIAYNWIDLNTFEREIEEAQSNTAVVRLVNFARISLALAPLIITWLALFIAADSYQKDILLRPKDATVPFLLLWQEGFHSLTQLTFSVAAIIDVTILVLLLMLSLSSNMLERRAKSVATNFVRRLSVTIGKLIEVIVTDSLTSIPYGGYAAKRGQGTQHGSSMEAFDLQEIVNPSNVIGDSEPILHIRIMEEPLTILNFRTIISSLTELHTKCWLIQQGRLSDLVDYAQTHDTRFIGEANLIITKLTLNSPADIKLAQSSRSDNQPQNSPLDIKVNVDASPKGIMEALRTAIDAVVQVTIRFKAAKLEIRARELDVNQKEMEWQSQLADREQNRHLEAQKAELIKQKTLLEIEREQVEIERQRLALQGERLELEKKRVEYALETANKMVDILNPGIDDITKALLARTLLPNLLQLGNSNGLELVPLVPENAQSAEDK